MANRHLPVRPNLDQLRHQAKDLLRAARAGDQAALAEIREHGGDRLAAADLKLAQTQWALARSYGVTTWPRLVQACKLVDAIWRDDPVAVRDLVRRNPRLLHEDARGVRGNWGPPMSYAANLGRDQLIALLHDLGADDVQFAFERACLQGQIETARRLYALGGSPRLGSVMGPCETLSGPGLALLLELGAGLADEHGDRLAPVALLLETYARNPRGKHACLDLVSRHGITLPDTPTMAVHRGRSDLLAEHLRRDPGVLHRTFSHAEIYPPELGCHADESLALHGTPLAGTGLLHLCVEYDEIELARWLIEQGADVNAPAEIDGHGFGGHTALFACVVSQAYRCGLRTDDLFARLLLDHGADPGARASLRKRLRFVPDESVHEYRDVTSMTWGQQFQEQAWVNRPAMALIAERGSQV